jgi:hypothetical protein
MVFDELVGYPGFENHEILALWLWMKQHERGRGGGGVSLCAMGHKGRINATDPAWKSPTADVHRWDQSAWFQVMSLDGRD